MEEATTRIESLIPYREIAWDPKRKLGTLNTEDSPWAIAAKLGRYLLSDARTDFDAQRELAVDCYCTLFGARREYLAPFDRDDAPSWAEVRGMQPTALSSDDTAKEAYAKACGEYLAGSIVRQADPRKKDNAVWCFWDREADCLAVIGQKDVKARYLGESRWGSTANRRATVRVRALRLPTALGAIELVGDDPETALTVCREGKAKRSWRDRVRLVRDDEGNVVYDDLVSESGAVIGIQARRTVVPNEARERFMRAAAARWGEEHMRSSMRRWACHGHSATVFEDKMHCDEAHRSAAGQGFIGSRFGKVEIDDDVDLGLYRRLDEEFAMRSKAGELPAIDLSAHQLRFRKTLRHRATGLFAFLLPEAPHRGIAVDIRTPSSMLHEMAHAFDFENGLLSLQPGFGAVRDAFRAGASPFAMEASDSEWKYAHVPTEIFARSWEVYAAMRGIGGSFAKALPDLTKGTNHWMYEPLIENKALVCEYFDALIADRGILAVA